MNDRKLVGKVLLSPQVVKDFKDVRKRVKLAADSSPTSVTFDEALKQVKTNLSIYL